MSREKNFGLAWGISKDTINFYFERLVEEAFDLPMTKRSIQRWLKGDSKVSQRRCKNIKDVLDWSEMEVAMTFFKDVVKTSSRRRFINVFQETSSRRLPGNIFKTSSKRHLKTFSRTRPQDLFQDMPLRCLRLYQDFFW